ncbi:MAG: nitrilase-related carbon-nitrogen hydrolase [Pirellulaceae bacterium]
MPRQLRIGLAQIAPRLGDRDHNLQVHREFLARARGEGADLVVFPELSLTGYFLRDMVPDVALPADAAELRELVAGDADVVVGFVERSARHRFYNSGLYAERGALRHVHRKVYLPTYGLFDEQRYFAAGHRIQAFDTERFGRVGLLVCEDFWHLSAAAVMQAEDVDVLVCIANSPGRGVQHSEFATATVYDHVCRSYAVLLGAVVVLVNRAGYEDGLCFWGGSRVISPSGDVLALAPQLDESLTVATVDWADVRRERTMTPLARDERLLLTIEELKRVKRRMYDERD